MRPSARVFEPSVTRLGRWSSQSKRQLVQAVVAAAVLIVFVTNGAVVLRDASDVKEPIVNAKEEMVFASKENKSVDNMPVDNAIVKSILPIAEKNRFTGKVVVQSNSTKESNPVVGHTAPNEFVVQPQNLTQEVRNMTTHRKDVGPLTVCVVTSTYFSNPWEWKAEKCSNPYNDTEFLDCRTIQSSSITPECRNSTALLFHLPTVSTTVIERYHPKQLTIAMSMESAHYYPNLLDEEFMSQFDIEMTYRRTSDVVMWYMPNHWPEVYKNRPLKSLGTKIKSMIMGELMKMPELVVHSFGACNKNADMPEDVKNNKVELFSRYRFCVAMENSVAVDYMSEKLWQALEAGCIPIYLGPPNLQDFLPVPINEIVLDYKTLGTAEALRDEVLRLAANDTAYNEMMRWRSLPLNETLPSFQALVAARDENPDAKCHLCQVMAKKI